MQNNQSLRRWQFKVALVNAKPSSILGRGWKSQQSSAKGTQQQSAESAHLANNSIYISVAVRRVTLDYLFGIFVEECCLSSYTRSKDSESILAFFVGHIGGRSTR